MSMNTRDRWGSDVMCCRHERRERREVDHDARGDLLMRVASANCDEETNETIGTEFGGNQIRTSRRRGLLATKVETTLRSGD
jgi:hypothetical protein